MSFGLNRAERLRELERLYAQPGPGFTDIELAQRFKVDRSVIFKDRCLLEADDVPLIQTERGRYTVDRQKYLSNIRLSLNEALVLYLSARRLSRHPYTAQKHVVSALEKLAVVLQKPMTERLVKAATQVMSQTHTPVQEAIWETLARGWTEQLKVQLWYRGLRSKRTVVHRISPYLIEPSLWGDGAYVVGYSDAYQGLTIFKIERIEKAELTTEPYVVASTFDEEKLFQYAWGIWPSEGEPKFVKLRFIGSRALRRLQESIWHPHQQIELATDGSYALWTAPVAEWQEMVPWIRSWGSTVEVLEPRDLRDLMIGEIRRLTRLYGVDSTVRDSSVSRLLRCWGKTDRATGEFHPAIFHMLDVGHVAQELLSERASPRWRQVLADALGTDMEMLIDWLPWLVALHDIGKISAAFQALNEAQKVRLKAEGFSFEQWQSSLNMHHTVVGQAFMTDEIAQAIDPALSSLLQNAWREMIGGHHGRFTQPATLIDASRKLKAFEPKEWTELRLQAAAVLKAQLLQQFPEMPIEPPNISTATMALTGFTILCDWLGSDSRYFQPRPETPLDDYVTESTQRAKHAVETAGFFQSTRSQAPAVFATLFPDRIPPRPLQQAIDALPASLLATPCLAIIEAPTGEGKTEAALTLAHRLAEEMGGTNELYYALPTMATSNQMFGRVQKYLIESLGLTTQTKLIHGQAFLVEDDLRIEPLGNGDQESREDTLEWFGPKKRSLLAPFGVGTIDQIELAALNVKHTALRMAGLAGKVVIIDEVHAYDTYMTTIIERLLSWLSALGTSVILLSATLPKARRAALVQAYGVGADLAAVDQDDYPSLRVVSRTGSYIANPPAQQSARLFNFRSLHLAEDEPEAKARWLLESIADGGCACWITNTVARAQNIFKALKELTPPDIDCMVLHASFPLEERQGREEALLQKYGPTGERPKRGIVIGTQVLEQSLDLDFDLMVSDLAPIDLLLQRLGRLHRHARPRPSRHAQPYFWINSEMTREGQLDLKTDQKIYAEFILRQTWLTVADRAEIILPADYRPLIEAVYGQVSPPADDPLAQAWTKLQQQQAVAAQEANLRLLPEPDPTWSFCARAARLMFEEDENRADWVVGQTRLGQESLTIIPLERQGQQAWITLNRQAIDLDRAASRELQLQLLRRSLRLSRPEAIRALKAMPEPLPKLFTESALLKGCMPLWLVNGQTRLTSPQGSLILTLDPDLGLVITKETGV